MTTLKNLYKVKIERTTYQGQKSIETSELFATSPSNINKYRLGGFQQDSIKILSARKLRKQFEIEMDADIERNELSFSVSLYAHLDSTLDSIQLADKNEDLDIEEDLELCGYIEVCHDNTYNYSSDFDNDMDFKVYDLTDSKDWIYSKTAIVVVYEHTGLDARAGYRLKGLYKAPKCDGFYNFLEFHVRLTVIDSNGNDVDSFEGDSATYNLLKEYKIKSFDSKTQDVVLTKDNEDFTLSVYHPAMGV